MTQRPAPPCKQLVPLFCASRYSLPSLLLQYATGKEGRTLLFLLNKETKKFKVQLLAKQASSTKRPLAMRFANLANRSQIAQLWQFAWGDGTGLGGHRFVLTLPPPPKKKKNASLLKPAFNGIYLEEARPGSRNIREAVRLSDPWTPRGPPRHTSVLLSAVASASRAHGQKAAWSDEGSQSSDTRSFRLQDHTNHYPASLRTRYALTRNRPESGHRPLQSRAPVSRHDGQRARNSIPPLAGMCRTPWPMP